MRALVRVVIPAVVVLALAAGPAQAGGDFLKVHLAAWPTELSGFQEVDGDVLAGSATDFSNTLGLGSDTLPEIHLDLNLPGPINIVGSYFSSSYAGEEILTQDVNFDDIVYSIGEQLESAVDVDMGKLMMKFNVLNFERLGVGVLVGANFINMKSQVESAVTGQASKDLTAPIPSLGVNLRLQPIKKLAIYAEVSGLSLNSGRVDATSIDGIVRLEYMLNPWIGITGGYRIIDLDVTDDDFGALDFEQDGGQFGMVFKL